MVFKPWRPNETGVYVQYRPVGMGQTSAVIKKVGGVMMIADATQHEYHQINSFLMDNGIEISQHGMRSFQDIMTEKGLLASESVVNIGGRTGGSLFQRKPFAQPAPTYGHARHDVVTRKTSSDFYRETLHLDMYSAPFSAATLKNIQLSVDDREPQKLHSLLSGSKLEVVTYKRLALGDIRAENTKTGDVLIIERKTVTDLHSSIVGSSGHAHDQAERYFDEIQKLRSEGKRCSVVWLVEGEKNGDQSMYNSLEKVQQMDGWVNYITMIVQQQILQTYSLEHTAYLTLKLIQGFFEQTLFYKVKTGSPLVNRSAKDRNAATVVYSEEPVKDRGVTRNKNGLAAMLSYIPSIKKNVAEELAKTGLSFKEIVSMSKEQLMMIKGVGERSAMEIFEDFNKI